MFSDASKRIQAERGSRAAYAKVEARGFNVEVDEDLRAFLAGIDTAFLATTDASGQPYIQHRGGPKGFIRALDQHTLAFVDYTGNRQYISTGNLTENAKVCLFLIDYEHRQRVKVWGTARMVDATPELLASIDQAAEGSAIAQRARAEQVCLITVTRWDVNCPQHIPQKIDASQVTAAIKSLHSRIAELEAENNDLRARMMKR